MTTENHRFEPQLAQASPKLLNVLNPANTIRSAIEGFRVVLSEYSDALNNPSVKKVASLPLAPLKGLKTVAKGMVNGA